MTDDAENDAGEADLLQMFREERVAVGEPVAAERDRERFALLYQVGKRVLSASSLDDLNELALSLVFDCVNAERGALLLRDSETGELTPHLVRRSDREPLQTDELRVPRSIIDAVTSGEVGILTCDALHDPRFGARASVQLSQIRSALCAPLWVDEQVLGAIYLDSRLRTYAFTREDLLLLNAIANLIAIRLKQAALHSELTLERVVRSNLERYHSPDVVEAILAGAKERGRPDGGLDEREVTILFADLAGFTLVAEHNHPSIVADYLNEYYELATAVIFEHGGTVNEYVGDSVLAIFGAPIAHEDHAKLAVEAGIHLLRELDSENTRHPEKPKRRVRVAINSGRVMVGSIGPPDRLKYAVIGDPVNVAARLERLGDPNTITLGEETFRRLNGEFGCDDLGPQQLRGRERPVRAYRIKP